MMPNEGRLQPAAAMLLARDGSHINHPAEKATPLARECLPKVARIWPPAVRVKGFFTIVDEISALAAWGFGALIEQ
jgi:hypothetical protein